MGLLKNRVIVVLSIIVCVVLGIGIGLYAYLGTLKPDGDLTDSQTDPIISHHDRVNILVLGLDMGNGYKSSGYERTDTIFVASFDTKNKKASLLSIPRDSRVEIPRRGMDKINAAHVYGGPDLTIQTVKEMLGVPIHFYVTVNYEGFKQIVDELGGVEIYIEEDMRYVDKAQNLNINISKGQKVLNGEKSLEYVRYRGYPNADIGRIAAQQKFLSAFAKKLLRPNMVLKIPRIAKIVSNYVETNMGPMDIVKYAELACHINYDDIKMAILPGTPRDIGNGSYYIIDYMKADKVINELLIGLDLDIPDIKVEVLNGNGQAGSANKVASELKRKGFDVINTGNADSFDYKNTVIIYKDGNVESAKKIASIVGGVELRQGNFLDNKTDICIIIGED